MAVGDRDKGQVRETVFEIEVKFWFGIVAPIK